MKVPLSPENVAALAAAMAIVEPRYEILVWEGACAGVREGEAFGLKDTSVNWEDDLLYVRNSGSAGRPSSSRRSPATPPSRWTTS